MTDLIYPKTSHIDDGCDWTKVIIWRMNAGARARSRACYVPAPRPIQVNPPKATLKRKKSAATAGRVSKTEKTAGELSAQKLVAIMKGKTLSYQGIMSAIKKYHPDIKINLEQLQKRVFALCMSNLVGIVRHDDMPVTHFTLKSVDPRFYIHSEKNMGA